MEEQLLQYLREEYPRYEDEINQLESWLSEERIILENCNLTTADEILEKIRQLIPISENTQFTVRQILRNTQNSYQRTQQQPQRTAQQTQHNAQRTQQFRSNRH